MVKLSKILETAGVTILFFFISSVLLMGTSPYHSDRRGAAYGALGATALLEFLWVLTAGSFALFRWKVTTTWFRVILAANGLIAILLALDFFRS